MKAVCTPSGGLEKTDHNIQDNKDNSNNFYYSSILLE